MCGGFRWPQAETVVVFDNGDAALHASLFGCFEPLARIGLSCRSELAFWFSTATPLFVGIGVHSIMIEGIELRFIPFQLPVARHRKNRGWLVVSIFDLLRLQFKLTLGLAAQRIAGSAKRQEE